MCLLSAYYLLSAYTFFVINHGTRPNVRLKTRQNYTWEEKLEVLESQVLTSASRSPFTMYTANQPYGLFITKDISLRMKSNIIICWHDDHELFYYNIVTPCLTHLNYFQAHAPNR